jgi:hypothetical protein
MTSLGFIALEPELGWVMAKTEAAASMDWKKFFMITAVAFVLVSLWHNPTGTANAFSDFLGNVGSFLEDAIDKFSEFFRSLTA